MTAPVHDRHHFREFVFRTESPAPAVASALEEDGFAVHVVDDDHLQACVTDLTAGRTDDLVAAVTEAV